MINLTSWPAKAGSKTVSQQRRNSASEDYVVRQKELLSQHTLQKSFHSPILLNEKKHYRNFVSIYTDAFTNTCLFLSIYPVVLISKATYRYNNFYINER